jgi:hypothetical protein
MIQEILKLDGQKLNDHVANVVKSYVNSADAVWHCYLACLAQIKEHGNSVPMSKLLDGLSKRQIGRDLKTATRELCGYKKDDGTVAYAVVVGETGIRVAEKAVREAHIQIPLDKSLEDIVAPKEKPSNWELNKAVLALVQKAIKNGSDPAALRTAMDKAIIKAVA